ncbi:2874_t:CDS:1, partial [Scutellospora calospora]
PSINKKDRKHKDKNIKNISKNVKDTSQSILNTSLSSTNSTPKLSLDVYSPMLIHVPLNPDLAFISNELYENYLAGTNLNANNAFNNQTTFKFIS